MRHYIPVQYYSRCLKRTTLYFMGLVNLRYGFQINPAYIFQAMAEFSQTRVLGHLLLRSPG
jgi:hypothetical protein